MRIADTMLYSMVNSSTRGAQARLFTAAERAVTGQKVSRPSDDPMAARQIVQMDRMMSALATTERTRQSVRTDLELAENLMLQGVNLLQTNQVLALNMQNDDNSALDRENAAIAVEADLESLISMGNSQSTGGRFLFAGVRDQVEPYPDGLAYSGSASSRLVEASPGAMLDSSVTGAQSFGDSTEMFDAMRAFAQALRDNDTDAIGVAQDELKAQADRLIANQAAMGKRIQRLDGLDEIGASMLLGLQVRRANIAEVDPFSAISEFTAASNSLDQVVSTSRALLSAAFGSFAG